MRSRLLSALACESVDRPPVWLMRQAGRYLPEYRQLRAKHSLWTLFHEPELAVQVTLQPLQRFPLDAAIMFSDILVLAEALGLKIAFPDQGGPRVEPSLDRLSDLKPLDVKETLSYVFETIRLLKKELTVPLLGFSGAPFTLACYFIDSTSRNLFERTKRWMKEDPASFHQLLSMLTTLVIDYLQEQVKSGVNGVQVFDSWANSLNDEEFAEFSLPYLKQIVDAVQTQITPVIVFCRDSSLRVEPLVQLGARCLSFDWHRPIEELRLQVPSNMAIQGNFPPDLLKCPLDEIGRHVERAKQAMQGQRGWIVNLGHGVTPDIPVDHVRYFVDLFCQ